MYTALSAFQLTFRVQLVSGQLVQGASSPGILTQDLSLSTCIFLLIWQIRGPDQKVIYTGERETNGKYAFAAYMDGTYHYCFSNKMSSMTPKIVKFSMDLGEPPKDTSKEEGKAIT